MAVINSGLVPKALMPGLAGSPSSASPRPQARQPQGQQAPQPLLDRLQVVPRSKGGLMGVIRKAARGQLAAHNCGGTAFHNGSAMAYPIGKG